MARGHTGFRRTGSTRRLTSWIIGPFGTQSVGSNTKSLVSTSLLGIEDGRTIVRIRGEVNVALTAAGAAVDGYDRVGLGMAVVTEQAISVGITAVPGPLTDINWDGWMWHWTGGFLSNTAFTLPSNEGPGSARIVIDSKAMRKFGEEMALVAVLETLGEVSAATLRTTWNTRVLEKLP